MKQFKHIVPPAVAALLGLIVLAGCGGSEKEDDRAFETSGSREADQRAEQRMARERQIRGGEGKEEERDTATLYQRLGGAQGIRAIVDDFVDRALADPRVNWRREGVTYGGILRIRDRSAEWRASSANVARLKKHLAQFLALATGGPAEYQGRGMKEAHRNLRITNAEFDAAVGDMKATLDSLRIADEEQKALLAILESTRPQVVEER